MQVSYNYESLSAGMYILAEIIFDRSIWEVRYRYSSYLSARGHVFDQIERDHGNRLWYLGQL